MKPGHVVSEVKLFNDSMILSCIWPSGAGVGGSGGGGGGGVQGQPRE